MLRISTTLGIPVESIAPQRACCLERMRRSMALLGLAEKQAPTLPEVVQMLEGWDDEQLLGLWAGRQ